MKIIECFEVLGHTDTTEGRGPMKVVVRFKFKSDAEAFVKSKEYSKWCVMGYQSTNDMKNIKKTNIVILYPVDEYQLSLKEELKVQALSKLTQEERDALGL